MTQDYWLLKSPKESATGPHNHATMRKWIKRKKWKPAWQVSIDGVNWLPFTEVFTNEIQRANQSPPQSVPSHSPPEVNLPTPPTTENAAFEQGPPVPPPQPTNQGFLEDLAATNPVLSNPVHPTPPFLPASSFTAQVQPLPATVPHAQSSRPPASGLPNDALYPNLSKYLIIASIVFKILFALGCVAAALLLVAGIFGGVYTVAQEENGIVQGGPAIAAAVLASVLYLFLLWFSYISAMAGIELVGVLMNIEKNTRS